MEKEINLLRAKEKISAREVRLKRLFQVGSSLLLIFYILVLGSVFSYWLIQERETRLVADKIKLAKGEINSLKKIESLQIALKERLKVLTTAFKETEVDYEDILTFLEQQLPSGVNFESWDITKSGEITITGSAENSLSLGEFLANLSEPEKEFKNIVLPVPVEPATKR